MQNRQVIMARKYLQRFEEILNQMSEKMLSPKIANSITINFIECMILHHEAAIYMSENLLTYSRYLPLQEIANNIIKKQTKGIEEMKQITRTSYGFQNMTQEVNHYMEKYFEITKNMIEEMRNTSKTVYINWNFVNEMIPHHEGAIAMCENLLMYRIAPGLKPIAESIIQEQSKGVLELKEIRKRLGKN